MPDLQYKSTPILFLSQGVVARKVEDVTDLHEMLNLDNCEELAEGAYAQRLGSIINNANGTLGQPVYALSSKVITVSKLGGLAGNYWRYAGTSDGKLWRRAGLAQGAYTQIASGMSGNPFWTLNWTNPDWTSSTYLFIADSNGMLKDNGSFTSPQQLGIFPPQFPVQAQSQQPTTLVELDDYPGPSSSYSYSGIAGGTINAYLSTTLTSAVSSPGIQAVTVASTANINLFQLATIDTGGSQETVLVILVTPTGFVADFTKVHSIGAAVSGNSLEVTVPASTTATISLAFGGKPIPISETVFGNQSDYIGSLMYVSDPTQVQSVMIKFDCGDGSFNSDYFYKTISQGPLQQLLTSATESTGTNLTTALTNALLSQSLDLYGNQAGGIGELNTGLANWTPLLFQLSDFAGAGRADYADPVFNWANVNSYQITIVTNDNTSATLQFASLVLFGGAGPDTLGGVAYDYVATFLNPVDGTESNPTQLMTNQNPPNNTNWVYPRRQPVLLNINITTYGPSGQLQDTQIGYLRIYRRGGTLGDNFRRIDQIPINIVAGGTVQYLDTTPDYLAASGDFVSFTNDVPVPSLLVTPVNTTLQNAITVTGAGSVQTVTPVSMSNISVRQQVTLGTPTAIENNYETVVVLTVGPSSFTAFVQNSHSIGEQVQANYKVGQPVYGMVQAYNQNWYWGDPNNPSTLYYSTPFGPQYVSESNSVIISTPDDIITAVASFGGNLYVSCLKTGWYWIAPGTAQNPSPVPYPTKAKHACVGSFAYVVTEQGVFYMAIDGIRFFDGGASEYLSLSIEFLFQGIGSSPIVEANLSQLSQTVAAYWNNYLVFSYIGTDGNRHRIWYHTEYKRFRNDDFDSQCLYLEADTNQLISGDSNGLVHIDRQDSPTDQINSGGVLANGPIALNLQTAYSFQGAPDLQKNYVELQLDTNTGGVAVTVTLLFNDGEFSETIGTFSTTQRQKTNFILNNGLGFQAYKAALQLTANAGNWCYFYQCEIRCVTLARTRLAFDSWWLDFGNSTSKYCKDLFFEYSASQPINFQVFYDGSPNPGFTFSLPATTAYKTAQRVRLPAVLFRQMRVTGTSSADFQIWNDSMAWYKFQDQSRGYSEAPFVPN